MRGQLERLHAHLDGKLLGNDPSARGRVVGAVSAPPGFTTPELNPTVKWLEVTASGPESARALLYMLPGSNTPLYAFSNGALVPGHSDVQVNLSVMLAFW